MMPVVQRQLCRSCTVVLRVLAAAMTLLGYDIVGTVILGSGGGGVEHLTGTIYRHIYHYTREPPDVTSHPRPKAGGPEGTGDVESASRRCTRHDLCRQRVLRPSRSDPGEVR